jgi:hypothetical protein
MKERSDDILMKFWTDEPVIPNVLSPDRFIIENSVNSVFQKLHSGLIKARKNIYSSRFCENGLRVVITGLVLASISSPVWMGPAIDKLDELGTIRSEKTLKCVDLGVIGKKCQ